MAAPMRIFLSKTTDGLAAVRLQYKAHAMSQIRGRKPNIKHPRPGHIVRQIVAKVTAPMIDDVPQDPTLTCTRRPEFTDAFNEISQYEAFLIRHTKKLLSENGDGFISLLHLASTDARTYNRTKVALRKQRMYISRVNRKVFSHATKGTQYENLNMVIFQSTALVVCQEPKIKEFDELLKTIPSLYPLCAVVEGQLLSKTELETYASYPDKPAMLGQTCAILNQSQQKLKGLLTSQQEQLVRNLQSYAESSSAEKS